VSEQSLKDVLAAHADSIVSGEHDEVRYERLMRQFGEDYVPLLDIARQVKTALERVKPSEAFRRRLGQELLVEQKQQLVVGSEPRSAWRQTWVIGAAAAGSVISIASAVGLILYRRKSKSAKAALGLG